MRKIRETQEKEWKQRRKEINQNSERWHESKRRNCEEGMTEKGRNRWKREKIFETGKRGINDGEKRGIKRTNGEERSESMNRL